MIYKLLLATFVAAPAATAADIQSAATDICSCYEAAYDLSNKVLEATAQDDQATLSALQASAGAVQQSTTECIASLHSKYPEISQSQSLQAQVLDTANKLCPPPEAP